VLTDMPIERLLENRVSVPEAIARVLEQAGIEFVFGMPGGRTGAIFNALYDHRATIRTVLVREEGLATVMADAYGRLTGRPGVAMGQGAFLLTNAGMGIVEAFLAGSPVVLLSDLSDSAPFSHHAPYQTGTGEYGTWDAKATIAGYTKQVFVAHEAAQAVQQTQLAIKHALAGQPGPVAVLYHSAALVESVGPETTPRLYATPAYLPDRAWGAQPDQVEAAARRLAAAARPVILAGNGVRMARAQAELRSLAELLGAPVATTASGKGVFPETHALALGVFGTFGLQAANVVVAEADVVLAVGTKLGPTDTARENPDLLDPERQGLIQVDVEPRHAGWSFPAEHVLLGDAAVMLGQLEAAVKSVGLASPDGRVARAAEAHQRFASFDTPESRSEDEPILPQRLIKDLHRALPDDAIVTCDAGENRLFMLHHFQTRARMEYLQPAAVGGMGYAIPAALAARLVHPRRTAVAVCGDGGFAIAMNGLLTAIEERIPIVAVVFDNSALGWVRHGQGDRPIASEFGRFDYAAIARAMGCRGLRVEHARDLPAALEQALGSDQPAVVDVVTSGAVTFKDVTSPLAAYPSPRVAIR
jgi:acetolactate synthase I/II/III large subunit